MLTISGGMLVQMSVIRQQGIDMLRDSMRATILGAENTRQSISAMREQHIFDDKTLIAEATGVKDYRQTRVYKTIPVVAAWMALRDVADREHMQFRVPAENARNRENEPTPQERKILEAISAGDLPDYFQVNADTNQAIYARPIKLSKDCLVCHGSPSNSPTHDGKDLLGFSMEGWKVGDRHGAFILRSSLDRSIRWRAPAC